MKESLSGYGMNTLNNLESKLSQLLQPVHPDMDFVNTLKTKITHVPSIMVETTRKGSKFLMMGIGVIVGAIAIWLIGKFHSDKSEE